MKTIALNSRQRVSPSGVVKNLPAKNKLTIVFIVCFISIMFSGISSMLMSVYLPVAVKDLLGNVTDEKMNNVGAYINSIFIFGSMFGGFAWGIVCDRIGRSKTVVISTALYWLFTILTAFSSSWIMVGALQVFNRFWSRGRHCNHQYFGMLSYWPERKKASCHWYRILSNARWFYCCRCTEQFAC